MTREEFNARVFSKILELEDLVDELPDIEELDNSIDYENYDQSKSALLGSIMSVDFDLDNLSDLYFDEA